MAKRTALDEILFEPTGGLRPPPPAGRLDGAAAADDVEIAAKPPSGDPYIDGLLGAWDAFGDGTRLAPYWGDVELTVRFPTAAADYTASGYQPGDEQSDNFESLNAMQMVAARAALELAGGYTPLSFTEVTETATVHAPIRYAMTDFYNGGWAWLPGAEAPEPYAGDVWFNNSSGFYDAPQKGGGAWTVFLHETGHALGLPHGHDAELGFNAVPLDRDGMEFTVMTYRATIDGPLAWTNGAVDYAQSFMMLDIAALQYLYGADFTHRSGDTVYSFSADTGEMFVDGAGQGAPLGNRIFLTLWDGGGEDTYDFSNYDDDLTVDLRPGLWSNLSAAQRANLEPAFGYGDDDIFARGNVYNALLFQGDERSLIENAFGGAGDDSIHGNQAANWLVGGGGADILIGAERDDILDGGSGGDTLSGGDGRDNLSGGDGDDALKGQRGSDTLDGGDGNDDLRGVTGADVIDAGAGADFVHGGNQGDTIDGGADNDTLLGGAGTDTIHGDGGDDTINGGAHADTLLGDDGNDVINGLTGSDVIDGGAGDDDISGASGADVIDGGTGIDDINGGGGADVLDGGDGNDILFGGSGTDTLRGGDGDDTLTGGTSADILNGGAGTDVMAGGGGGDTFVFTSLGDSGVGLGVRDQITDFSRAGGDTIDLSAIDADSGTGGDQAFLVVGAFTASAGELVVSDLGGGVRLVELDVDGDAVSDMSFEVTGPADLGAGDFVL